VVLPPCPDKCACHVAPPRCFSKPTHHVSSLGRLTKSTAQVRTPGWLAKSTIQVRSPGGLAKSPHQVDCSSTLARLTLSSFIKSPHQSASPSRPAHMSHRGTSLLAKLTIQVRSPSRLFKFARQAHPLGQLSRSSRQVTPTQSPQRVDSFSRLARWLCGLAKLPH
jgi:hypothetical protein